MDPFDEDEAAPGNRAGDNTTSPGSKADEADSTELRRKCDEYYDLLLRKTAEFDNYRRRVERERRESAELAAGDLLEELLPLIDDLDRALNANAGPEGADAYRRGVEIIHRQLQELLRKRGVVAFESVGQDFDPHVHQAVSHEHSPDHREGEVIQEFRRGYKLGDRLLRPAMVKVAKS